MCRPRVWYLGLEATHVLPYPPTRKTLPFRILHIEAGNHLTLGRGEDVRGEKKGRQSPSSPETGLVVSKSGNTLRKVNSFGPRSHFFPSPITSFFHPILLPKLDRFVLPGHALLWRRIKIQIGEGIFFSSLPRN